MQSPIAGQEEREGFWRSFFDAYLPSAKARVMRTFALLVFLGVFSGIKSQAPCTSIDDGPFLATSAALSMDVYEASQQDLVASPERHRAQLRLQGVVGEQGPSGIVVDIMPDYQFMNPEDTFRFVARDGINYVELYSALDRDGPTSSAEDDTNVFSFTLKCSLQANMSDYKYYDAKIFVMDVNDNDPKFVDLPSTLTLNELTPLGLIVLRPTAEDKDINLESNLTYSVVTRNDLADDLSRHFEMDHATGELSLRKELDFESRVQGRLVLSVVDGGDPARTTTATVEVRVEDGDDQGPAFVYPGCWKHRSRCAWPKYTTSTTLDLGIPLTVFPVPNKIDAEVTIQARDLDDAANPIVFAIASTIPAGRESLFTVSTRSTGKRGEYAAVIYPTTSTTVNHGFEIFLRAEEQSSSRRFEVAMVFFEDPNYVAPCFNGTTSKQTGPPAQCGSNPEKGSKYSEPIVALIVVVSILAALLLCLAIGFFRLLHRSHSAVVHANGVSLTRM